jgi:hypothetical protein
MHFVVRKKRYLHLLRWHLIIEYDGSYFEGRRLIVYRTCTLSHKPLRHCRSSSTQGLFLYPHTLFAFE